MGKDKARQITPSTQNKLFGLSNNQCYAPDCQNILISDEKNILAKIAHIEAASPNGARYNPKMNDDERRAFDNLILLCDECHIKVDHHPDKYPTSLLKKWKKLHERTDKDYLFRETLINQYKTNFNTISFLLDDNKKPIDDIFINLSIIKEHTKPNEDKKLISRESILNSYEEIHKPKEPIAIEGLLSASKKSLIYGKAGIGKTTLCRYIAYKWARGELYQEFDFVIYIPRIINFKSNSLFCVKFF